MIKWLFKFGIIVCLLWLITLNPWIDNTPRWLVKLNAWLEDHTIEEQS